MIQNRDEHQDAPANVSRVTLIRDTVVFQFKLVIDGFRDVVLVPVSLVAAAVSFLRGPGREGVDFYAVLRFGKDTERWINLFGAAERQPDETASPGSLDSIVDNFERQLLGDASREELPAVVRERLEKLRETMRREMTNGFESDTKD